MPRIHAINGSHIKSVDLTDAAGWAELFGTDATGQLASIAEIYRDVPIVRKCAKLWARSATTVPWGMYRDGAEEPLWTDVDAAKPPKGYEWLRAFDGVRYRQALSIVLTASAYHLRLSNGSNPTGFQYLSPSTITPKITGAGVVGFKRKIGVHTYDWPAERVLYVWDQDPWTEIGPGSSDGNAARAPGAVVAAMSRFAEGHLRRGAVKGTILRTPEGTDPKELERVENFFTKWFSGSKNSGRVKAINADAMEVQPIGEGLGDIDNTELTDSEKRSVADAFSLSYSRVMDNAANFATAWVDELRDFDAVHLPAAERIFEAWNEQVLMPMGLTVYAEPERAPQRLMAQAELSKSLKDVVGKPFVTAEEARLRVGLTEVPESGELYVPPAPQSPGAPDRPMGTREAAEKSLRARYGDLVGLFD